MNGPFDLARRLVGKAESDLTVARTMLKVSLSLDAVCFHAQQVSEKYLKAYLAALPTDFPFIHDLEELIRLCSGTDATFKTLLSSASELSPYAVELRYEERLSPSIETAARALQIAETIREFVRERLPKEIL